MSRVQALMAALRQLQRTSPGRIVITPLEEDIAIWHVRLVYQAAGSDEHVAQVEVRHNVDGNKATLPQVSVLSPRLTAPFIHSGAVCMVDFGQAAFDAIDSEKIVLLIEQLHFRLAPDAVEGYVGPHAAYELAEREAGLTAIAQAHPEFEQAVDREDPAPTDGPTPATAAAAAAADLEPVRDRRRLEKQFLDVELGAENASVAAMMNEFLLQHHEQVGTFTVSFTINSSSTVDLTALRLPPNAAVAIAPAYPEVPLTVRGALNIQSASLHLDRVVVADASILASGRSVVKLTDVPRCGANDGGPATTIILHNGATLIAERVTQAAMRVACSSGSNVQLRDCELIAEGAPPVADAAVINVTGRDSRVHVARTRIACRGAWRCLAVRSSSTCVLSEVTMESAAIAVFVTQSATLDATDVSVAAGHSGFVGVYGSAITARRVKVTFESSPHTPANGEVSGFTITSRCRFVASGITVVGFFFGVDVEEASSAELDNVTIEGGRNGITVSESACAIDTARIANVRQVGVFSTRASVVTVKAAVIESFVNGLEARSAQLTADMCRVIILSTAGFGCIAEADATVHATDCSFGTPPPNHADGGELNTILLPDGVACRTRAKGTFTRCEVHRTSFAFTCRDQGLITAVQCAVRTATNGVTAVSCPCYLTNCTLLDCYSVGVFSCEGGDVTVTGGEVSSRRIAIECDRNSEIHVTAGVRARIENMKGGDIGVCFRLHGHTVLSDCEGAAFGVVPGDTVFGIEVAAGTAAVAGVKLFDFTQGVTLFNGGVAFLTSCIVARCAITGIAVLGSNAALTMVNGASTIEAGSIGVDCGGEVRFTAEELRIVINPTLNPREGLRVALFCRDGGYAEVLGGTLSGPGFGCAVITQTHGSVVLLRQCVVESFEVACKGEGGAFSADSGCALRCLVARVGEVSDHPVCANNP